MIKRWHLKAIIQKLISFVPVFNHRINYAFQKHITKGVDLNDDYFRIKTVHLNDNFRFLAKYQEQKPLQNILEIGTGWYPINPIGFYLLGANDIVTYDISPLTDVKKVLQTCQYFLDKKEFLLQEYGLNFEKDREDKLRRIVATDYNWQLDELLAELSLKSIVGYLADDDLLADLTIQNVVSNNTFEHIPEKELEKLLIYLFNQLPKGGCMSHFIDMTDHYAHMDSSITVYHFLKFSQTQWNLIDNDIQPMNRLRYPIHRAMHINSGFKIQEEKIWPYDIGKLEEQLIHSDFASKYSKEELATVHAYIVSKKV